VGVDIVVGVVVCYIVVVRVCHVWGRALVEEMQRCGGKEGKAEVEMVE
jgi:hypothetical protein